MNSVCREWAISVLWKFPESARTHIYHPGPYIDSQGQLRRSPTVPGSRYTEVLGDVGVDSGCGFQLLWTQNEFPFSLGFGKEGGPGWTLSPYGFQWDSPMGV